MSIKQKYNLLFSREEAALIIEALDMWISIYQSDIEYSKDTLERTAARTAISGIEYIKQKIEKQINTKKKILNFKSSYVPFRSLFQMANSSYSVLRKKSVETTNKQLALELKNKVEIYGTIVERLRRLPYIGQSEMFLKEGTNELKDEFINYWV